ncbi:MAG TPA: SpoIIE family protein phosphatase [Terriglobia bacterium]|nr:SpoIIE family protein phosphatase [Terriglobia bacterium]
MLKHKGLWLLLFLTATQLLFRVLEAMNSRDEEFGEGRRQRVVSENLRLSAVELQKLILAEIERFAAGGPQHDDMTLVVANVG